MSRLEVEIWESSAYRWDVKPWDRLGPLRRECKSTRGLRTESHTQQPGKEKDPGKKVEKEKLVA